MSDSTDRIELDHDVALLLFEMLARAGTDGIARASDSAERRALYELEAELERSLPELFLPTYGELLANARRRLSAEDDAYAAPRLVAFVDVDDTLVRSVGAKRIPMTAVIQRVRELSAAGFDLYCWSTGGAEYARRTAIELGLADCFAGFLAKPNVLIDDQVPSDWRGLVCLHPNEASSMSASEIETVAAGRTR
jgi:phosphoglycolate phosphatase-like HAD superfamily hydrolase